MVAHSCLNHTRHAAHILALLQQPPSIVKDSHSLQQSGVMLVLLVVFGFVQLVDDGDLCRQAVQVSLC